MILSDRSIEAELEDGKLEITPFDTDDIEPASVDLRLGEDAVIVNKYYSQRPVDTRGEDHLLYEDIDSSSGHLTIHPNQLYLATTKETVSIPRELAATVLGRSSLGRLGVSVHQTAGFIDPGFEGEITLEMFNHGPAPVDLHVGDRICQMVLFRLDYPARDPYGHKGSQYQGQTGATPSGMQFD